MHNLEDNIEPLTYGDLKNSMVIYIFGYKMRVSNVHNQNINNETAVRFNAHCVGECDISNTGYDGAIYGGYSSAPIA